MAEQTIARLEEVVSACPNVMHGALCFAGTRVPVQTPIDYLEESDTVDRFLEDFGTVTRHQAISFLELAKEQMLACVSC